MSPWSAAQPGDLIEEIDTPALILDLDAFERNLARMEMAVNQSGLRLRPHAKSHKCPEIAQRQIARGAVGICCQKVSEAAVFVQAGVKDILVTNQVVGAAKLARLIELAQQARIGVLVDAASQVTELAALARQAGVVLDVYIEVEVGMGRCGIAAGQPALELARQIAANRSLHFAGLHCYHGSAQHMREPQQRAAAVAHAARLAHETRELLNSAGIPVKIITGAGTGTFIHERDSGIYNELQPGSYIFMDRDYADNQRDESDIRFEHSLFILTSVVSRPSADRTVIDAGLKAYSVDSGMPGVWQRPDVRLVKASDEHGILAGAPEAMRPGEKLLLVPGHCDPTVNLYDTLVCVRDKQVEALWPVAARGALL